MTFYFAKTSFIFCLCNTTFLIVPAKNNVIFNKFYIVEGLRKMPCISSLTMKRPCLSSL